MSHCLCNSNKAFEECCGPYLSGNRVAPTPEALMRSRYTAYVKGDIDYIAKTMCGSATEDFDAQTAKEWSKQVHWLALEIVSASTVDEKATKGTVEFIARYRLQDRIHHLHEVSEFEKIDHHWFYVDGRAGQANNTQKIGRNDPCSCGSGKKYKKCCGG